MKTLILKIFSIISRIFKFAAKLSLCIIVFAICLFIVIVNLPFYDYGIDKSKIELAYPAPSVFHHDKGLSHNFAAVLHALNDTYETHWDAIIYIEHLKTPPAGQYKKGSVRVSKITVHIPKELIISIDTIKLEHKSLNGDVIKPIENNLNEFITCLKKPTGWCSYEQVYDSNNLPRKLIEKIDIKFTINGEERIILKTYPIEKAFHFSGWKFLTV